MANQNYIYKMVSIPTTIATKKNEKPHQAVSRYLENVVTKYASNGWDFYRVDELTSAEPKGCLSFSDEKFIYRTYNVVTFRREATKEKRM